MLVDMGPGLGQRDRAPTVSNLSRDFGHQKWHVRLFSGVLIDARDTVDRDDATRQTVAPVSIEDRVTQGRLTGRAGFVSRCASGAGLAAPDRRG